MSTAMLQVILLAAVVPDTLLGVGVRKAPLLVGAVLLGAVLPGEALVRAVLRDAVVPSVVPQTAGDGIVGLGAREVDQVMCTTRHRNTVVIHDV